MRIRLLAGICFVAAMLVGSTVLATDHNAKSKDVGKWLKPLKKKKVYFV